MAFLSVCLWCVCVCLCAVVLYVCLKPLRCVHVRFQCCVVPAHTVLYYTPTLLVLQALYHHVHVHIHPCGAYAALLLRDVCMPTYHYNRSSSRDGCMQF